MTTLKVLAKGFGWELFYDLNSVLWLSKDGVINEALSPIEALRMIPNKDHRFALAKQVFEGGN